MAAALPLCSGPTLAPPAGCPIYTRNEVLADTLVHVVGVPFGIVASYLMLEEVHARLPQVRGARVFLPARRSGAARQGCRV